MNQESSARRPDVDLHSQQMDLWWPGPPELYMNFEILFKHLKQVTQMYAEAFKDIAKTLTQVSNHVSPPVIDINVLRSHAVSDHSVDQLHIIREKVAESLIRDFDADPTMAEQAALNVEQEHVDEYPDLDDLVEHVYDTQSFWPET